MVKLLLRAIQYRPAVDTGRYLKLSSVKIYLGVAVLSVLLISL